MMPFGIGICVGALLLFLVQPMLGKYILPWFGGIPAVWTGCLIFFQVGLFVGYLYAHALQRLALKTQVLVHSTLLFGSLFFLPLIPDPSWKPDGAGSPMTQILVLLTANAGLPFLLLSATGPLMQSWMVGQDPNYSPYRWFALSNLASLLALWIYPFFVEAHWTRQEQGWAWAALYLVYAGCLFFSGWKGWSHVTQGSTVPQKNIVATLKPGRSLQILLLAAGATLMLVAITNHVCQDLPSFPLFWVIPLSLYLISLVLCFQSERFYPRALFLLGMALACISAALLLRLGTDASAWTHIVGFSGVLFIYCMALHGELALLKPSPQSLSAYYLWIAAGGALGGLLGGMILPVLLDDYFELHLALFLGPTLLLLSYFFDAKAALYRGKPVFIWMLLLGSLGFFGYELMGRIQDSYRLSVHHSRNFFGVLRIKELRNASNGEVYWVLAHGGTNHGFQCFAPEEKQRVPMGYYGKDSGIEAASKFLQTRPAIRAGLVGLGIGSAAAYARAGDRYFFYEINPQVVDLAKEKFTMLRHSQAQMEFVLGDARTSLEKQDPQNFDLLLLDAFNSDSIPVHLLTREAFLVYQKHLKPDGLIAAHVSNRHLDVASLLIELGKSVGMSSVYLDCPARIEHGAMSSKWVLLASEESLLARFRELPSAVNSIPKFSGKVWTDDYANILQILR